MGHRLGPGRGPREAGGLERRCGAACLLEAHWRLRPGCVYGLGDSEACSVARDGAGLEEAGRRGERRDHGRGWTMGAGLNLGIPQPIN